jgi:excisionase family DNA binding protein
MNNTAVRITNDNLQRVISLTEACNYIGVKKATMYSMVYEKKIPAFKMDGSRVWKFDRVDLDKWIQEQKERGANGY